MAKLRLLMEKRGFAAYISHLDLMRTMRRAFTRAEIPLRYSEGFNPHPVMSFALPLSVCHESVCELLDFETVGELPENALKQLNSALPEGLFVSELYAPVAKFGLIKWLEVECRLIYKNGETADSAFPENTAPELRDLFSRDSLVISKRTKRGESETDIIPQIHSLEVIPSGAFITLRAVISAQNPTLNPQGLISAISAHTPRLEPDTAEYTRLEVFDERMKVFR